MFKNTRLMRKLYGLITVALITVLIMAISYYFYMVNENYIYQRSLNSIVEIKSYSGTLESYGTGVVISDSGQILTNFHVISYTLNSAVATFDNIEVRLPSKESYDEVDIVKYDENIDLALLELKSSDEIESYKKIKINYKTNVKTGDICYAIGNATNLSLTMSKGIISNSAVYIDVNSTLNLFIQSNIDLAKGSSGGALLDKYGRLIGITTMRLKDSSGDTIYGFGYSIPIEIIQTFIAL